MTLWLMRRAAAILHELLKVLDEHKHVTALSRFAEMLHPLSSEMKAGWQLLTESARGSAKGNPPKGSFALVLKEVRDKSGSHYDVQKLQAGYAQHFTEGATDPQKAAAYYSDGMNMERTRFYFADAAAEGVFESHVGLSRREYEDKLQSHIEQVNNILKFALTAWLLRRGAWRPEYDER